VYPEVTPKLPKTLKIQSPVERVYKGIDFLFRCESPILFSQWR